jgi:hypothetical protein
MRKAMFNINAVRPRDDNGGQLLPCRSAPIT